MLRSSHGESTVAPQKKSWLSEGPKVPKFSMHGIYVYLPMYLYAIDDVYIYTCIYLDDGSICHTKLLSIYLSSSSIAVFFWKGTREGEMGGF